MPHVALHDAQSLLVNTSGCTLTSTTQHNLLLQHTVCKLMTLPVSQMHLLWAPALGLLLCCMSCSGCCTAGGGEAGGGGGGD